MVAYAVRLLVPAFFALMVWMGIGHDGAMMTPAAAQVGGEVPGNWSGNVSDAELWRAIRKGVRGNVSIPDKKAGVLVQSGGESWRLFKNGPLVVWGVGYLLAVIVLLGIFYAVRGRIEINAGIDVGGRTIERFNYLERAVHWLTASSFIILALTGLNMLYGRYVLLPVLGPEFFAAMTLYGKYAHDYIAFAFMVGIVLMFILWVRHNIPERADWAWFMKGGGLFSRHTHVSAKRFNAGQKVIFWLVILGGLSLSISGLALIFPFEIGVWEGTFALLNMVGFDLPQNMTMLQETQLSVLWHGAMALVMTGVIIAHIYIGSVGMEGAMDAMGTGQVDVNWAREHHGLWVDEVSTTPHS